MSASDGTRDDTGCERQSCKNSTVRKNSQEEGRDKFKGASCGSRSDKGKQRYHRNRPSSSGPSTVARKDGSHDNNEQAIKTGACKSTHEGMQGEKEEGGGSHVGAKSEMRVNRPFHQNKKDTRRNEHVTNDQVPGCGKGEKGSRSHHRHELRPEAKVDMEVTFGGHRRKKARHNNRVVRLTCSGFVSGEGSEADSTASPMMGDSNDERTKHSMTRVKKIPGFYYDHEKKRYFKILPGHSNPDDHVITSETIKAKETERTRLDLMRDDESSQKAPSRLSSAPCILHSMQRGDLKHRDYIRLSTECRIRVMSTKPSTVYEPSTDIEIAGISPVVKYVELDRSRTKIMVVLSSDHVSRIILGSISGEKGTKKELQLQEWQDVYVRNSTSSQISSAKLINIDQQDDSFPGNLYVLFSWSGDYSNAVQLVKCPSENDPASYVGYRFESPGDIIRSCSWSSNPLLPAHLCIGFSREAEIIDILSSGRQRLDTKNRAVWSQVFSKTQPIIHLGLKHGCISTYDLRTPCEQAHVLTRRVKQVSCINHGGCVCSLTLLNDENYLLAGSTNGTIKLWDLRQRTVVQELHGHCNEYKPLPVNKEQTESFVYAVGQDKHTRIWSMEDGHLLKTIASPVTARDASTPSVVFSLDWGGSGLPGVMIGATNKLFWYPL